MSETDIQKIEFEYILKTKFGYASKGETAEATFITLFAPTSKTTRQCAALKQAFFRAMGEQEGGGGEEQTDSSFDIEGSDVMALLAMSKNVDLPDVIDISKQLFKMPGIALVDGETKLGESLIDRMSVDDIEDMLGEYMINFILASSLKRLREKSSKVSQT
jgi:hypothetical protein